MTKDVKGFEGLYSVDENGRVYSKRRNGYIKPVTMNGRYQYVHLLNKKDGIDKTVRLHRIVAEAFIANPNNYTQVNHINGNKCDNRAANLEWCNAYQNMRHAINAGLWNTKGEHNPSAKLTAEQVKKIRKEYIRGSKAHGTVALGAKYGVSSVMIGKIVNNKNWVFKTTE